MSPNRALALILLVISVSFHNVPAHSRGVPNGFADLAEKLLPSVVNISTTQVQKTADKDGPQLPRFPEGSPFQDFLKSFLIVSSGVRRSVERHRLVRVSS